jgi:hypothetical protein
MLKRIKQNLVKDKEISILMFLYFLILNCWYNEISNNYVFDKLLKLEDENFYFIPYLTSVIFNSLKDFLTIEIIGYFSVVIAPTLILFLTKRVFDFFLSSKLSFLLALLTQSVYNNINLRDLFLKFDEISVLVESDYLLIFNFPFPSISVLFFLIILYKIINIRKLNSLMEISILTVFIFSFFYVNAIDSFFLITAWLISLIFDLKKLSFKNRFFQILFGLLILMPGILNGDVKQIHEYSSLNLYNVIVYNLLPLIMSVLLYLIKRIDLKEVWFKFKIIYVFIFAEIFLNLLVYLKILNIDLVIANRQVLQFPIHMMYYLPLIYFLKRTPFQYNYGIESQKLSLKLSRVTFFLFEKSKNFIFYSLVILIFYFNSLRFIL